MTIKDALMSQALKIQTSKMQSDKITAMVDDPYRSDQLATLESSHINFIRRETPALYVSSGLMNWRSTVECIEIADQLIDIINSLTIQNGEVTGCYAHNFRELRRVVSLFVDKFLSPMQNYNPDAHRVVLAKYLRTLSSRPSELSYMFYADTILEYYKQRLYQDFSFISNTYPKSPQDLVEDTISIANYVCGEVDGQKTSLPNRIPSITLTDLITSMVGFGSIVSDSYGAAVLEGLRGTSLTIINKYTTSSKFISDLKYTLPATWQRPLVDREVQKFENLCKIAEKKAPKGLVEG